MTGLLGGLGGKVVDAVSGHYAAKAELKQTRAKSRAKLAVMKADKESQDSFNAAEVQALRVKGMSETWIDEYITVLVTSPLSIMMLGALIDPIFPAMGIDYSLFNAGERMLKVLTGIEGEYAWVFHGVVVSALGLREVGKRR